jgi:hypothetical protein
MRGIKPEKGLEYSAARIVHASLIEPASLTAAAMAR